MRTIPSLSTNVFAHNFRFLLQGPVLPFVFLRSTFPVTTTQSSLGLFITCTGGYTSLIRNTFPFVYSRDGTGSAAPVTTPAGFCVFLSDPESKSWEKPDPESRFNFGTSRSLCGHFLSKNMGKIRLDL